MAQFKQWALEYVLSDDETVQLEITKKAAKGEERTLSVSGTSLADLMSVEIESSRASSIVVGNWAASVQPWMTSAHADDQMDDGEDAGSGDIIARAKGMPVGPKTLPWC